MEDVLKSFNEDLVGRGSIREEYEYVYVVYYDVYVYIYVCFGSHVADRVS